MKSIFVLLASLAVLCNALPCNIHLNAKKVSAGSHRSSCIVTDDGGSVQAECTGFVQTTCANVTMYPQADCQGNAQNMTQVCGACVPPTIWDCGALFHALTMEGQCDSQCNTCTRLGAVGLGRCGNLADGTSAAYHGLFSCSGMTVRRYRSSDCTGDVVRKELTSGPICVTSLEGRAVEMSCP